MDAQPQLASTAALTALVQALARLELEQGYASQKLVGAQEVLAENRFIAARDATAAEFIDPGLVALVPLPRVLDDVLAAARPHAAALDSVDGARRAADGGSGARATPAGAPRGVGRRARARRRPRGALRGLRSGAVILSLRDRLLLGQLEHAAPAGRARRSST